MIGNRIEVTLTEQVVGDSGTLTISFEVGGEMSRVSSDLTDIASRISEPGLRCLHSLSRPADLLNARPEFSAKEYYPIMLDERPSLRTRLHIRVLGSMKIGTDTVHFSRPNPVYVAKCSEHEIYFLDYLRGWPPAQRLICPRCLAENRTKT